MTAVHDIHPCEDPTPTWEGGSDRDIAYPARVKAFLYRLAPESPGGEEGKPNDDDGCTNCYPAPINTTAINRNCSQASDE